MPGPDPVCSARTPQLPPELDSQLPIGVPIEHAHNTVVTTIEVVVEAGGELIGEFLLEPFAGASFAAGGALSATSAALTLWGVATLPRDSHVGAMIAGATECDGSPESRARALGYAAGLAGMSDRELAGLRERLPPGLRTHFQNGAAQQRDDELAEPRCAADARAELRGMMRSYADGMAAAVGGWNDASRGAAFEAGHERMRAFMQSHPCDAESLRAQYRGDFRAGFQAADRGPIDPARYERDAAYRIGVEHERALERAGDERALEAERARIGGVSVRDLSGARIAG